MSQENVEFVRNLYALIDRGDAAAWNMLPRDFVIDLSRRRIDPVVLRGPDELRTFYGDLEAPWAGGASLQVEELIDAGDQVLVLIRFGGRGKMSGAARLSWESTACRLQPACTSCLATVVKSPTSPALTSRPAVP